MAQQPRRLPQEQTQSKIAERLAMSKAELESPEDAPSEVPLTAPLQQSEPAPAPAPAPLDEDRLISLGDVSRQLRVYVHAIVFWEQSGLIRSTVRNQLKCVRVSDMNRLLEGAFGPLRGKKVQ